MSWGKGKSQEGGLFASWLWREGLDELFSIIVYGAMKVFVTA